MKKSKSIVWKLSSMIIGLFLALFLAYSVVTSMIINDKSVGDAESSTLRNAEYSVGKMSEHFNKVNEQLLTTKRIVEGMHEKRNLSAEEVIDMLKVNLTDNDEIFAVYAVLENDSVEIEPTISKALIDDSKRFIPYLVQDGDQVNVTFLEGYESEETGDWYWVPKKEKRAILTEPYEEEVNGEMMSMTTLSVPLIDSTGTFFGILSADMSVDYLAELVTTIKPDGGYSSIITEAGMISVNSNKEKMNGTYMKDSIDWDSVKKTLDSGKPESIYVDSKTYGEEAFNAFAPMMLEGIDETWTVQLVLPNSKILETFNEILFVNIASAIIMVVLMAAATARFIYKALNPLTYLRDSIETAAEGNLTKKIDEKYIRQDEIGAVSAAYNNMLDKTNDAIHTVLNSSTVLNQSSTQVNGAFDEIVASSQEVSVATDEIATGAARQSEDTEETGSRMIDLSNQIDSLTVLSAQMDTLSNQTKETTEKGMNEIASLREHNAASNEMNEKVQTQIETLTSNIANINQVIASIQGISNQTNLLALNASIEAARAGEHGKGFAVVAEEVRKLAEQSKNETEVIRQTVESIVEDSKQTVSMIAANMQLMKAQNESVQNTEAAFKDNHQLAQDSATAISQLVAELTNMLEHKNQAMMAIQNISAISEETAASAEQVSASAADQQAELERVAGSVYHMTTIAQELQEVVDRFKLS